MRMTLLACRAMPLSATLHEGVTFHDGSPLTSADAKASWDKIVFPPEGGSQSATQL
jgi:ABC-type transport system substrate-binding protein